MILLKYTLTKTTQRLTFDIIEQAESTRYRGEDDGPYFKFVASNGYEVYSRSRMDIQTERLWLLGAKEQDRSGSMVFSSNEKRDEAHGRFKQALEEWAAQYGGHAVDCTSEPMTDKVYKEGTTIEEILIDGWSRGFHVDQTVRELKGMGFEVDEEFVHRYWSWWDRDLDKALSHSDDIAVDKFAGMMKTKLAKSREKGRGGWDDPEQCTVEFLAKLLIEHIRKGDPVDVANLAMMLSLRNADGNVLKEALDAVIEVAVEWERTLGSEPV
jgi:hypothetical protein